MFQSQDTRPGSRLPSAWRWLARYSSRYWSRSSGIDDKRGRPRFPPPRTRSQGGGRRREERGWRSVDESREEEEEEERGMEWKWCFERIALATWPDGRSSIQRRGTRRGGGERGGRARICRAAYYGTRLENTIYEGVSRLIRNDSTGARASRKYLSKNTRVRKRGDDYSWNDDG